MLKSFLAVRLGNRPFQGLLRHFAGGARTLGRARGQPWRPYILLGSERKFNTHIILIFSSNIGAFLKFLLSGSNIWFSLAPESGFNVLRGGKHRKNVDFLAAFLLVALHRRRI